MKKIKIGSVLLALSFVSLTIASCNNLNTSETGSNSQVNQVTHVVTFNPNNGESEFTKTVKDLGYLNQPSKPVYEGHNFEGWYTETNEQWNFIRGQVTEDMTLTAKWTETGSNGGNEDSSGGNEDSSGGSEDSSGDNEDVFVPDGEVLTVGEALAIAKSLSNGEATSEKYYVEGNVTDIYNTMYGNFHLYNGNDDLIVYGLYSNDGTVRFDAMKNQPKQDDKVVVYGVLKNFYDTKTSVNKYEIENGWLISVNGVEYSKFQADSSSSDGGNEDSSGDIIVDVTEGWTNTDFGSYYNSVNFDSSNLLVELQKLNSQKRTSTVGYKNMPSKFYQTDYDPNNKSKVMAFYAGTSAVYSGNMNREHVWPNSRGGNLVEADIHAIRPTLTSDNSSRGNSFYVEGMAHSANGWDPKTAGMKEQYRGQAARIIFYCCVASNQLSLVDKTNDDTGNKTMGKLSDLLKWNLQYGVAQTELNRNNGAQSLQGNRNPFIDNPGLACSIWGNTNAETKKICSGYVTPEKPDDGTTTPSNPSVENPDDSSSDNNTPAPIDGTWTLVTSASQLKAGDKIVIAETSLNKVAGKISSAYLSVVDCSCSSGTITSLPSSAEVFTLGGSPSAWTLTTTSNKLLGATAVKKLAEGSGTNTWTIDISNSKATIQNTNSSYGRFLYNVQSPRFTTYTSDTSSQMLMVAIFKLN